MDSRPNRIHGEGNSVADHLPSSSAELRWSGGHDSKAGDALLLVAKECRFDLAAESVQFVEHGSFGDSCNGQLTLDVDDRFGGYPQQVKAGPIVDFQSAQLV